MMMHQEKWLMIKHTKRITTERNIMRNYSSLTEAKDPVFGNITPDKRGGFKGHIKVNIFGTTKSVKLNIEQYKNTELL